MNWVGDLEQKYISENDTVLSLGCGIMQELIDIIPTYPQTVLKCKELVGVDIFQNYIDVLEKRGIKAIKWDLRDTPLPFKDKSYDVVLLNDILEHLDEIEHADNLINESERIARKYVMILVPNRWDDNLTGIDAWDLGHNEFQRHKVFISREYLKDKGYKVWSTHRIHFFAIKKIKLKILHIYDVAGVAGCMSKYQQRLGHEVRVLIDGNLDHFRFGGIYKYDYFAGGKDIKENSDIVMKKRNIYDNFSNNKLKYFMRRMYYFLRSFIDLYRISKYVNKYNPDIIHIHVVWWIPFMFLFRKKLIEIHGTATRKTWFDGTKNDKKTHPDWSYALYKILGIPVYYSTPDLHDDYPDYNKPFKSKAYIENPVDTELFKRENDYVSGTAIYFLNHFDVNYLQTIMSYYKNLVIDVIDRVNMIKDDSPIKHMDLPRKLEKYEYLIDRHNVESISKTGLEFLALGGKIILPWNNVVLSGLSDEHKPENVAEKTTNIYWGIINGSV